MKTTLLSLTLIFSLSVLAQIPSAGLVGSWPFNGNANDESINNNNGTVLGATLTTDRFGNPNSAYSFDGVDDYISLGSDPALYRYNTDFTISAWVRRTVNPPGFTQPIFTNRTSNTGSEFFIDGASNSLAGHLGYATYNGSTYGITRSNITVPINAGYQHVVMVYSYNGSNNNSVKLYINNVLDKTTNGLIDIPISTEATRIGWSPYFPQSDRYFEGDIDDIFVYNRALDSAEVDTLYNFQPVGINDINNAFTTKIGPNPSNTGVFNVYLSTNNSTNNSTNVAVEVYNVLGENLLNETTRGNNFSVNISNHPKGVYFVKINIDGVVDTQKIVYQ